MKRFRILFRFLKFYFSAVTKYRIHSPFVFNFTQAVLEDNREFYAFSDIEYLRSLLKKEEKKIQVTDFGAGSHVDNKNERSIKSIANSALTDARYCRYLFRIINEYKPKTILEMGTSLGVSAMYMHFAAQNATLITLEGCPQIAEVAAGNFRRLHATNIQQKIGRFEETLPQALNELEHLDFVFIDGNHRKEPTIQYFNDCLKFATDQSVFIFDDNHWSEDMEAAWNEIKEHPKVTLSIDLFFFGLVFFKKDFQKKEHYKIVPTLWKPWVMGFFK